MLIDYLCRIKLFLKSRREDYEISPQFRTQMGVGYDFFASVRDGVSIQHAFRLTNLVLVVAAKAPYCLYVTICKQVDDNKLVATCYE
jgi:hypothetical protein